MERFSLAGRVVAVTGGAGMLGRSFAGALAEVLAARGLAPEDVAYVGNDVNDLACLAQVGLPVVVADAHEDVRPAAAIVTRLPGGRGAVREVCDLIVRARAARRGAA